MIHNHDLPHQPFLESHSYVGLNLWHPMAYWALKNLEYWRVHLSPYPQFQQATAISRAAMSMASSGIVIGLLLGMPQC